MCYFNHAIYSLTLKVVESSFYYYPSMRNIELERKLQTLAHHPGFHLMYLSYSKLHAIIEKL